LGRRFGLGDLLALGPVVDPGPVDAGIDAEAVTRFRDRMDDDLDTPGALASVFDLVREANGAADAGDEAGANRKAQTVALLGAALGLPLRAGSGDEADPAVQAKVLERDEARAAGDWARADALRAELEDAGWLVEDGPEGTRIRRQ
jgi:cysteinyl-tRNA synthetase